MSMISHIAKSMASGFFLIIGCCTLLASGNIYIGSALFAVALCAICSLSIPLYTGAVGFVSNLDDLKMLAVTLPGNMAGCAALGLLVSIAQPEISSAASELVLRRVYPLHIAFILAFVCGILMYTAVYIYRIKNSYIGIMLCVPVFIIGGFEHSIAYMGFMAVGATMTLEVFLNMLVFIIGNGAGAVLLNSIVTSMNKTGDKHT